MDYKYLFYNDFPKGVNSVCINGKKFSKEDFLKERKNFFQKRNQLNYRVLIEVSVVVIIAILLFYFSKSKI